MKQGFYKFEKKLIYAPNSVRNVFFHIVEEMHETYTYPIEGWYWFDSLKEACDFFKLDINNLEKQDGN